MKTKFKISEFSRALKLCFNAIDTKDPVRSNIKFDAEGEDVRIMATNGQYSVEVVCPSNVEEEGVAIVDGKMAYNVISKASGECTLTSDEKSMVINTSGRTKLPNMERDLPMIEDCTGKQVSFDSVAFRSAINKVAYAIGEDQSRLILTGAHIVTDGSKAVITSLDGFRLAQTDIICEGDNIDIVVPTKILLAICDAVTSGSLILSTNGSHITVKGESFTINAITLSGDYIDTSRIIPTDFAIKVLTKTSDLKDCLDSATVASGTTNLVKLDISNDRITVKSNSEEADFQGDISALVNGNDIVIAFNLKYLIHAINHIETEQCELCFNTQVSPVVIFPKSDDDNHEEHLILPVRIFGN